MPFLRDLYRGIESPGGGQDDSRKILPRDAASSVRRCAGSTPSTTTSSSVEEGAGAFSSKPDNFKRYIPNRMNQMRFKRLIGEHLQDLEQSEKIIAEKIGICRSDLIIAVAEYKPFVPYMMKQSQLKTNPVYIIVNNDAVPFEQIFERSIYHDRDPELPFVFIRGKEQREKFLAEYNRVLC